MHLKYRFIILALCVSLFGCFNDTDDDNNNDFQSIEWVNTYGGSNADIAHSVIQTSDGHIAILGYTESIDGDITDKTLAVNDF